MKVRRALGVSAFIGSITIAGVAGFLLFLGLWSLVAGEGDPTPNFNWAAYWLAMTFLASVLVTFGVTANALQRKLNRTRQRP